MNSQSSQARLPESDEAEMAVFLQKALQLMPVIGLDAFKKTGRICRLLIRVPVSDKPVAV